MSTPLEATTSPFHTRVHGPIRKTNLANMTRHHAISLGRLWCLRVHHSAGRQSCVSAWRRM